MERQNNREDFTFEIIKYGFVIGERKSSGYAKELNFVSFRGAAAKWDIREWNEDHTKMSKGVTLTDEELKALKDGLDNMDI